MSKRQGKHRDAKQSKPVRAPSDPATTKPSKPPTETPTSHRSRSRIPSAIIWFAVGGLLTLALAHQPSWPWAGTPAAGSTVNWPDNPQVFPEFQAILSILLSTSAIFFLLVPLANWSLPLRVLGKTSPAGFNHSATESAGYWFMWLALGVFALSFLVPGTTVTVARPAYPAGTVFWRAATGNAAVICWLAAVMIVWLAAVLASAGRLGQLLDSPPAVKLSAKSPLSWGIAIGACGQLLLYPLLAAVACGWLLDLLCGSEVFVPAGMMIDARQASSGGGPSQLWLHLFTVVAWPTVLVCFVPVAGLIASMFVSQKKPENAERTDDTSNATTTCWASRALLIAVCSFLTGILVTALTVRFASPGGFPGLAEMGLSWWMAAAAAAAMVVSSFCFYKGLNHKQDSPTAGSAGWIAGAALLAVLCGALAADQVRYLTRRGLSPAQAERLIYPRADLNYASAVRSRVQLIRIQLDTRAANEGSLSADDQALRDLCHRMWTALITPVENAVVENDDAAAIAGLAGVVAGSNDSPTGALVFEGSDAELVSLTAEMRARAPDLQLPRVVPGGRRWVGVRYLLNSVLIMYLAGLLTVLIYVAAALRGSSRAARLRRMAPFWHLAAVFSVIWIFAG